MSEAIFFNSIIMRNLNITTHKVGRTYTKPHFFILNKGENAGKPSNQPWANCFVFQAKDEEIIFRYYWMSYALWKSKTFHSYLVGSVIPFLRLNCCKNVFLDHTRHEENDIPKLKTIIKKVRTMEEIEKQYMHNLALIQDAKISLARQIIRRSKK